MKIGIVGSVLMGGKLGTIWARTGHDVTFSYAQNRGKLDRLAQDARARAGTPAEAVQEMKISTNSYDAQYGRTAGGVVNMSLKSGTNSFHGVVYDFMRRKALAANSFLLNSRQSPKTDQSIDQYGFSVDQIEDVLLQVRP